MHGALHALSKRRKGYTNRPQRASIARFPCNEPLPLSETAVFARAAVAAPHTFAAEAGRDVLAQGGDAIEAMVAMAATIAVVYPHMNAQSAATASGSSASPADACARSRPAATPAQAPRSPPTARSASTPFRSRGPKAALTVPGAIGGWMLALELSRARGGRLPLTSLLEDAVRRARERLSGLGLGGALRPDERSGAGRRARLRRGLLIDGKPAEAGAMRQAPRLADTLDQLARAGLADFYRGDVGREIAADLERIGAPVTRADLKRYRAAWREPLSLRLRRRDALQHARADARARLADAARPLRAARRRASLEGFAHAHALIEAPSARWRSATRPASISPT